MNLSRKKDVDVKYAGKWVFYFVLIGVMSGLGAILFHYLCGLGMHYFMDMMAGYRPEGSAGEHLLLPHTDTPFNKWVLLFLPAFGRHYPGTDSNYQNHCLHHHTDHGRLRAQGRPHCPDRGGFGSFLATRFNLSERERCIMMAAGIGAGVGSIFRAPLAGALFAAEVLKVEKLKYLIKNVRCLNQDMPFSQFKQVFQTTKQRYFPVMKDQGELCGIFSSTDVREVLFSNDLEQLVVMKDIMVSNMITTTLSENLNTVLLKLTKKNIDALPVVDEKDPGKFIGMLYRRDIIAYYNLHVARIRESQTLGRCQ